MVLLMVPPDSWPRVEMSLDNTHNPKPFEILRGKNVPQVINNVLIIIIIIIVDDS